MKKYCEVIAEMLTFIPFVLVVFFFIAIGAYFAFFTRHFLAWTTLSNQKLHKQIDNRIGRPVLTTRARLNYSRMEANGALNFFIWSIRIVGIALIVLSAVNGFRIISLM
jgi:hypothetical protein